MKIIDLINKRANDEEVPKKIKFDGYEYSWNDDVEDYENVNEDFLFSTINLVTECLNYEVEILDEEDTEEIKIISSYTYNVGRVDETNIEEYIHTLFKQQAMLIENQKKIINKLNKE